MQHRDGKKKYYLLKGECVVFMHQRAIYRLPETFSL